MGKLRVIDFFCGAGGFSEGFSQAGFDVIWAVDKWKPAVITHQNNHPKGKTILGDVLEIAYLPDDKFEALVPDSEVIIGSPPCVDFSNSNRSGKADKSLGIKLIEAYLRIVARKKFKTNSILKYWILENVANSQTFIENNYTAEQLGLEGSFVLKVKNTSAKIYNAQYFSVPSKRERYICGDFPEPVPTIAESINLIPLKKVLSNLGNPENLSGRIIKDPNFNLTLKSEDLTDHFYIQELAEFEWKKALRLKQDKGYMGRMSFPENIDRPARTIMATMSFSARESMIFGYKNGRFRAPTIREVASIMSFPINYQFYGESISQKYHLVGNAVPPKLSYAFATQILVETNTKNNVGSIFLEKPKPNNNFYNINNRDIPIKTQQAKKQNSKFRYHIPYMIIDKFRVELTNTNSNFENDEFIWDVEIHYNQGKKARVFTPVLDDQFIEKCDLLMIHEFAKALANKIGTSKKLHLNFIKPNKLRETEKLIGPEELLFEVKNFIELLNLQKKPLRNLDSNEQKLFLPSKILAGYTTIKMVLEKLNGGSYE